jgi:hypothetical protein
MAWNAAPGLRNMAVHNHEAIDRDIADALTGESLAGLYPFAADRAQRA